jgi:hypothetical protein
MSILPFKCVHFARVLATICQNETTNPLSHDSVKHHSEDSESDESSTMDCSPSLPEQSMMLSSFSSNSRIFILEILSIRWPWSCSDTFCAPLRLVFVSLQVFGSQLFSNSSCSIKSARVTCWRHTVVGICAGVYQRGARGTWLKYAASATSPPLGTIMGACMVPLSIYKVIPIWVRIFCLKCTNFSFLIQPWRPKLSCGWSGFLHHHYPSQVGVGQYSSHLGPQRFPTRCMLRYLSSGFVMLPRHLDHILAWADGGKHCTLYTEFFGLSPFRGPNRDQHECCIWALVHRLAGSL